MRSITLKKKDPRVTAAFEKRLRILSEELASARGGLAFLSQLERLDSEQHPFLSEAPRFTAWLFEAQWREVVLTMARIYEIRRKNKDLKNLQNFIRFLSRQRADVFYRAFIGDEGSTPVAPDTDALIDSLKRVLEQYSDVIRAIMAERDKTIAHLTASRSQVPFERETLDSLVEATIDWLHDVRYLYDRRPLEIPKTPVSDFFEAIDACSCETKR